MAAATLRLVADPATGGRPFKTTVIAGQPIWVAEFDILPNPFTDPIIVVAGQSVNVANPNPAAKTLDVLGIPATVDLSTSWKDKKVQLLDLAVPATTVKNVKNATASPPSTTIELTDITGLNDQDSILILGKAYTISGAPAPTSAGAGTIVVNACFGPDLKATVPVQKLKDGPTFAGAGTRRLIEIKGAVRRAA